MKSKILWGTISILILLASAAFTPPVPEGPLPAQDSSPASSQPNPLNSGNFLATISPVQGEIYWRQATEQDWFNIASQQGLDTGNQVLTKTEGRAKIEYFDGIIVRIGPHTLFTVSEQSQTEELNLISRIRLLMGQIFIKHGEGYYQGKFEVETSSGLAAVKGTMMSVQTNTEGQTFVTCLEGICSLANENGELTLTEGQGARINGVGQPPVPAEIEDWQLADWFEADPDTIAIALRLGLITQSPELCTANETNCLYQNASAAFVNFNGMEITSPEEHNETDQETAIIVDPEPPVSEIIVVPVPPEEIVLPAEPVPPETVVEPTPEPEETPTPYEIWRCPHRPHHR